MGILLSGLSGGQWFGIFLVFLVVVVAISAIQGIT